MKVVLQFAVHATFVARTFQLIGNLCFAPSCPNEVCSFGLFLVRLLFTSRSNKPLLLLSVPPSSSFDHLPYCLMIITRADIRPEELMSLFWLNTSIVLI